MRHICYPFIFFFLSVCTAFAQDSSRVIAPAIEDNSFLVEEAYNQEAGVVQFIQSVSFPDIKSGDCSYGFTNEIPLKGSTHQISYSLAFNYSDTATGFGDALLNYRYELTGKDKWAATSPRLSLILPTGDKGKQMGNGAWGAQFNFPASKIINRFLVVHANAGYTFYRNVKKIGADSITSFKKNITVANFGLSAILIAGKNLHFMLEAVYEIENNFNSYNKKEISSQVILNPGLRFAFDMGKSQIVPGISFPTRLVAGTPVAGALFYLSIEPDFNK